MHGVLPAVGCCSLPDSLSLQLCMCPPFLAPAFSIPFPITLFSTCWPLLVLLLPLFPLVQLLESLSCLLQPGHEPFNVIQSTVKDLLRLEEGPRVSRYHPHLLLATMSQTQCQQEACKDGKESWKAGHPPFPSLFSEPAQPVVPRPGIPYADSLFGVGVGGGRQSSCRRVLH